MHLNTPSIIGWLGSSFYIIAYLLLSLGKLKVNKAFYHVLNILGALGLTFNAIHLKDYPNVIVNLAWLFIAMGAIVLALRKQR